MKTQLNTVYIDFGNPYANINNSGIERKKLAQIKELNKLGEVNRYTYTSRSKNRFLWNFLRRLPFFPSNLLYVVNIGSIINVDIVYIRRSLIDGFVINLLKKIRKKNPKSLILFEIPTYPYDQEMRGFFNYPLLLKEKWNRRKLYKYTNRIVLVASERSLIFKVPTLSILNGIDFSLTPLRKIKEINDNSVHGIIVGNFAYWHGLDRLIGGIKAYYKNSYYERNFVLHVVGPTNKVITMDREIEQLVKGGHLYFYGRLSFHDLEKIYDKVTIAFETFGLHRRSLGQISSSIKSREYGAKGLPIVSSSKIDYIPQNYPFFLQVPEDDSPVNIQEVLGFYDRIYLGDKEKIAFKIREFAKDRCSSEAMMKPVLEFCQNYFGLDC